jgi:hypothetical protein
MACSQDRGVPSLTEQGSAQKITLCNTHIPVQDTHGVSIPPGWSREDVAKLEGAISEEVARQLARVLNDPVTLCKLLLVRLQTPHLVELDGD